MTNYGRYADIAVFIPMRRACARIAFLLFTARAEGIRAALIRSCANTVVPLSVVQSFLLRCVIHTFVFSYFMRARRVSFVLFSYSIPQTKKYFNDFRLISTFFSDFSFQRKTPRRNRGGRCFSFSPRSRAFATFGCKASP